MNRTKTDAQVQQDVLREIAADTRVGAADVGVTVHRRIVTLTGTVDAWDKRLGAQEAAHRVSGVLDVVNELRVKPPGSVTYDDADIARAVRHALEWNVRVSSRAISTTVADGVVTVQGMVDRLSQREEVVRVLRDLRGVRDVIDRVHVRGQIAVDEIRSSIEGALKRHAMREAAAMELRLRDGHVEVRGNVESWAEKERVIGAIRRMTGVLTCEEHLTVGIENDRVPAL